MLNIILISILVIYAIGVGYSIHIMEETTTEFDMENMGVESSKTNVVLLLAVLWPILAIIGLMILDTKTTEEEVK